MPRSILKRLAATSAVGSSTSSLPSPPQTESLHVHFPPTPAISSTYVAHSPDAYDRAPIVVSPNSCELPERNERVYTSISPNAVSHKGSYFHPHAYEACELEPELPPSRLNVPDLSMSASSESEESDGYGSPHIVPPIPHDTPYPPIPRTCSPEEFNRVLSFLPHRKDSMCSLDSEEMRRTRRSKTSEANRSARSTTPSDSRELGLDGCLGGF
ncbi:hypothetical protein DFS33DRAFT_516500 [Desarmillaria ectypa]|nr:hypothetical protein DFS33DRAFT_516500 [Desarmillaria ectypa]